MKTCYPFHVAVVGFSIGMIFSAAANAIEPAATDSATVAPIVSSAADPSADVRGLIVAELNKLVGGPHMGFRANHAKGVLVRGTFAASAGAAAISKASFLGAKIVPVLVRFSDATGVPDIPDAAQDASPHGIAIRFELPNGTSSDILGISTNGFPVGKPEDFLALLQALGASGPKAAKPTPIEQFVGGHAETLRFLQLPKPAPVNFTSLPYYGVNAFRFINYKGVVSYGRYTILPIAGERYIDKEKVAALSPNYLFENLPAALANGGARFRILVQIAEQGDSLENSTEIWPATRKQVELGIVTLKAVVATSKEDEKKIMFSPLNLVDGIEPSDDPLLIARPRAYGISFSQRQQQ